MSKVSEVATRQTINVLLTLPQNLNEKLQRESEQQCRKRHAQIIFILEKYFDQPDGNGKKEKTK